MQTITKIVIGLATAAIAAATWHYWSIGTLLLALPFGVATLGLMYLVLFGLNLLGD